MFPWSVKLMGLGVGVGVGVCILDLHTRKNLELTFSNMQAAVMLLQVILNYFISKFVIWAL